MLIQAICFDADGVVVNPQKQFSRYLSREHGITPEMTRPFFEGVFNECLTGKRALEDVLNPFLQTWGWPGTLEAFISTWLERDHVVDARLLDRIQDLRRAGLRCCLVTSQEHHRAAYMRTRMGFQDAFDDLFFSCELGCQKPDPAYYHKVEAALGLPPQAILFWDDAITNVAAALEQGWHAELYTNMDAFETTLVRYWGDEWD